MEIMPETLRLHSNSDGWGTDKERIVYIEVDGWLARIAIIGDSREHAEELARDVLNGLTSLKQMKTVNKYEVKNV